MATSPAPSLLAIVLDNLGAERFDELRRHLEAEEVDPFDRDGFLIDPEVARLVHSLVPDVGLGDAVEQLAATVHHGYLIWQSGSRERRVTDQELRQALAAADWGSPEVGPAFLALPRRMVWARLIEDGPHEPLDAIMAYSRDEVMVALGVFGVHPGRDGFSVAEARVPVGESVARPDGSSPFSPTMPGGTEAGLASVATPAELALLASRCAHSTGAAR